VVKNGNNIRGGNAAKRLNLLVRTLQVKAASLFSKCSLISSERRKSRIGATLEDLQALASYDDACERVLNSLKSVYLESYGMANCC